MVLIFLLLIAAGPVGANPIETPVEKTMQVCDHNEIFKLRATETPAPDAPVLELDYKKTEGKTFPFCGLVDELPVYTDRDLKNLAFNLPICFQAYTAPDDSEKKTHSGNQKYFKVLSEHSDVLEIEDCKKTKFWIKRAELGTPLMLVIGDRKYPLEFQQHLGVPDKTKPQVHSFSYDWCGDISTKRSLPVDISRSHFLGLRREDYNDSFSGTECDPGSC